MEETEKIGAKNLLKRLQSFGHQFGSIPHHLIDQNERIDLLAQLAQREVNMYIENHSKKPLNPDHSDHNPSSGAISSKEGVSLMSSRANRVKKVKIKDHELLPRAFFKANGLVPQETDVYTYQDLLKYINPRNYEILLDAIFLCKRIENSRVDYSQVISSTRIVQLQILVCEKCTFYEYKKALKERKRGEAPDLSNYFFLLGVIYEEFRSAYHTNEIACNETTLLVFKKFFLGLPLYSQEMISLLCKVIKKSFSIDSPLSPYLMRLLQEFIAGLPLKSSLRQECVRLLIKIGHKECIEESGRILSKEEYLPILVSETVLKIKKMQRGSKLLENEKTIIRTVNPIFKRIALDKANGLSFLLQNIQDCQPNVQRYLISKKIFEENFFGKQNLQRKLIILSEFSNSMKFLSDENCLIFVSEKLFPLRKLIETNESELRPVWEKIAQTIRENRIFDQDFDKLQVNEKLAIIALSFFAKDLNRMEELLDPKVLGIEKEKFLFDVLCLSPDYLANIFYVKNSIIEFVNYFVNPVKKGLDYFRGDFKSRFLNEIKNLPFNKTGANLPSHILLPLLSLTAKMKEKQDILMIVLQLIEALVNKGVFENSECHKNLKWLLKNNRCSKNFKKIVPIEFHEEIWPTNKANETV